MIDLWEEMRHMQKEMDRLFSRPLLVSKGLPVAKQPETDLEETDKEIIATFDLPGVEKGDITLSVDKDSICVKAEKKLEKEEKKKGYLHQERSYSSFYRSFALPAEILADKVKAEYKNGVLTVKMPKKALEHKGKKLIDVKVK